jgi:hypothetical protein
VSTTGIKAMIARRFDVALTKCKAGRGTPMTHLENFGEYYAGLTRGAIADHGGHPDRGWSLDQQIGVALILRDKEHLDALGYPLRDAAVRFAGDLLLGLAELNEWLDAVRVPAGVETWRF